LSEDPAVAKPAGENGVEISTVNEAIELFGRNDQNLRLIERSFGVRIVPRGDTLNIQGPPAESRLAADLFRRLVELHRSGHYVTGQELRYAISQAKAGNPDILADLYADVVITTNRGKQIRPKTLGQKQYAESMRRDALVLGIGPAGTGKTYLAMAMAIAAFKEKAVARIILTRPAVEAGEKLGFLPGDLQEKVDPYLRPLYDALYDIMGVEAFRRNVERGLIEVAPLAYMRGRTLDDSFVILDEAQNTTHEQMKMFLTRLGFGSRAVVTGDVTQIDLPRGTESGLLEARRILAGVPGIGIVELTGQDVVRHELVQKIIRAYERYEQAQQETAGAGPVDGPNGLAGKRSRRQEMS
jgi:phosphate starvation-inducible PhoH-like protein